MNNIKKFEKLTGKKFFANDYSTESFQASKYVSIILKELDKYKEIIDKIKEKIKELDRFDCNGSMAVSMSISQFQEDLERLLEEIE